MNIRKAGKFLLAILVLRLAGSLIAQTQQITRIAVIDMQKIYMTYYSDSAAVRSLEIGRASCRERV